VSIVKSLKDILRYSNMALEDSPFADHCPTKISIYRGFSQFDESLPPNTKPPQIINTSGRRDYWEVFQEWMMSQLSLQAPQIPATESDEQVERRLRILTKIIEWLGIC